MTTPNLFGYMMSPKIGKAKLWQLIEDYEAPTINPPFSDFNHTFSFDAIDFDNFSMLVLVSEAGITGNSGQYTLIVNGITTDNYFQDGRNIQAGVESIFDFNNADFFRLATNSIIDDDNVPVHSICYIMLNKSGTNKQVGFTSFTNGIVKKASQVSTGSLNIDQNEITSIRIGGRIRGLENGTRATLYKVART